MKNIKISDFLSGLSAVSILIGLTLLGLALGNSLSTGIAMGEHLLFTPALVCMAVGVLNLMPIVLSGSSKPKSENS